MKQEISNLRWDIERKLTENHKELEEQKTSITEAQARIAELEEGNADTSGLLSKLTKQTRQMQDKLTDLEASSQRNNVRIFGLPEDIEGSSSTDYLDQLITKELDLPEGTDLQIQRAHRALVRKPGPGGAPRAVVLAFLKFETKEMILQKVWRKKGIQVGNKKIQVDHDYSIEIVQKRKTYLCIKRALKEKGIRFQTLFTKMRIHWNDGAKSYETTRDAVQDMRARGLTVDVPDVDAGRPEQMTPDAPGWQRVGDGKSKKDMLAHRAKKKLQEYERGPDI